MTDTPVTLREAARRISRAKNPKSTGTHAAGLLEMLRSGDLRAGIHFLNATEWIEIPLAYWHKTTSDALEKIKHSSNNQKPGVYRVKATKFPEAVSRILHNRIHDQADVDAFAAIIAALNDSYEVTIKEADLLNYMKHHDLNETLATPHAGAPRKEGWRELCAYVGAYMATQQSHQPLSAIKVDETSKAIHAAVKDKIKDMPSVGSLKEQIQNAKKLIESNFFGIESKN